MKVRFTPDARHSIRDKRAWWQEHRDKAPKLFLEELRAIVASFAPVPMKAANNTCCDAASSSGAS